MRAFASDWAAIRVSSFVPFASSADRLVVLARSDAGVELLLVDPNSDGVSMQQLLSQGREPHYRIQFDGVRVPSSARIGEAGSGWATWHSIM